jgi:hypothetical protein
MDLALTINGWIDEEVIFAQQLGAQYVFARVDCSRQNTSQGGDAQSLASLANRIEKAGLALAGLHAVGAPAGEGRQEEALLWISRLVHEAGASRIGLLSLSAGILPARRPAENPRALFMAGLAEAAERAGVKLAIPAAALAKKRPGEKTQVSPEEMLKSLPSSAGLNGSPGMLLEWLQKTGSGDTLSRLIREKLFLVSVETERGRVSRSAGRLPGAEFDDLLAACWRLRQAGYPGLIRLGEPARWKGDTRADNHARAFSTGYLRAVLQAFQKVSC